MVVTKTEFVDAIKQVNTLFSNMQDEIKELKNEVKELKESKSGAGKSRAKKAA